MKKLYLTLITIALFLQGTSFAFAQTTNYPEINSNPVYTTVGDYKEDVPTGDLKEAIKSRFEITVEGTLSQEQLKWVWEIFSKASKTNFKTYTRGSTITAGTDPSGFGYSQQLGCKKIRLHPHTQEARFKLTILHELGHIIWNCNGNISDKLQVDFEPIIGNPDKSLGGEGGITTYGEQPSCLKVDVEKGDKYQGRRRSEDFAETVAYYLMPEANEREVAGCTSRGNPPFAQGAFPKHFTFIKNFLGEL